MSYNGRPQGGYGMRPRRPLNRSYGSARIRKKTSWSANFHDGLVKIEDVKIIPSPIEYVSENIKSGAVKAGFKLANIEVDGATDNKTKITFPEKQKKPKRIDVV